MSRVVADVLVRRGLADVDEARAFIELRGSQHDPLLLGDMEPACIAIEAAISARRRIVVHGDYDVDGVCATTLACEVLAALGADVEPFLPSRFDEGYGLGVATVERLAGAGFGLLVSVDCGITAIEAVERAAELGLGVVITDHHRPSATFPACPVVAPSRGAPYPAALSGTGVAYKLGEALVARAKAAPAILDRVLDLVALATVADVVPLVGENRALVRDGLLELRRTQRPGLDALMRVAKVDRHRVGATEIGFRLAPRINAAGRLGHPREALELLTTRDEREAWTLAQRLDERNRERQVVEGEILRDALTLIDLLPPERRDAKALVIASTRWHVGVIGIVAARVAERLKRPCVLIALDGAEGRGSGRSIPTFDLHAALGACSEHLVAWGGHRAAAGVTVRADAVEAFAAAFAAYAEEALTEDDLVPVEPVDAFVSLADVSLALADDLAALEPHGLGNPAPRLLLPAVELTGIARLGADDKHLRFTARSATATCRTVMWGGGGELARLAEGGRFDLLCRVERNDWNGTSSVQITARTVTAVRDAPPLALPTLVVAAHDVIARPRIVHDHRRRGAYGELARLAGTGEGLLVVCADATRRAGMLANTLHPSRFGLAGAMVLDDRLDPAALARLRAIAAGSRCLALTDHATAPSVAGAFARVVVLDPPVSDAAAAAFAALDGDLHLVWGADEEDVARRDLAGREPRALCAAVWRALADGPLARAAVTPAARPSDVAFAIEVLIEAGLLMEVDGVVERVADPPRVDLAAVPSFAERAASCRPVASGWPDGIALLEERRDALLSRR